MLCFICVSGSDDYWSVTEISTLVISNVCPVFRYVMYICEHYGVTSTYSK